MCPHANGESVHASSVLGPVDVMDGGEVLPGRGLRRKAVLATLARTSRLVRGNRPPWSTRLGGTAPARRLKHAAKATSRTCVPSRQGRHRGRPPGYMGPRRRRILPTTAGREAAPQGAQSAAPGQRGQTCARRWACGEGGHGRPGRAGLACTEGGVGLGPAPRADQQALFRREGDLAARGSTGSWYRTGAGGGRRLPLDEQVHAS